jgi:hypothetical protein
MTAVTVSYQAAAAGSSKDNCGGAVGVQRVEAYERVVEDTLLGAWPPYQSWQRKSD